MRHADWSVKTMPENAYVSSRSEAQRICDPAGYLWSCRTFLTPQDISGFIGEFRKIFGFAEHLIPVFHF